jgi:hypothetical protein
MFFGQELEIIGPSGIKKGDTTEYYLRVKSSGENFGGKKVEWSLSETQSQGSSIESSGPVCHVTAGKDEGASQITLTAVVKDGFFNKENEYRFKIFINN